VGRNNAISVRLCIGHPILDERGDVVEFVGASTDVTEHHRADQALRRSEAYLAEAHRLAKTGSWTYSPAAEKAIYWSDEMLRIFGLDPQTSDLPDREQFLRMVHPEDRERFNGRIDKAFRDKTDFVQDYRIVLTDGTVKHIHGIGHPVLDETGNIIEYVGTDVDVTERKRDEEKLRRREAELLEAQRLSHTGSWKHDIASGRVTVSPEVSFAREKLSEHGDAVRGAIQAGNTRFRPVIMTALAMIIGMVPMALGFGDGGEQNAPLGRAVIGGLLCATMATLIFVPSVFTLFHWKAEPSQVQESEA